MAKSSPQKLEGDKDVQGASPNQPLALPAALGECLDLGITPELGSHGPNSQQETFFHDFL